jgi:hypothetical protein
VILRLSVVTGIIGAEVSAGAAGCATAGAGAGVAG